jgi:hypothetical protein
VLTGETDCCCFVVPLACSSLVKENMVQLDCIKLKLLRLLLLLLLNCCRQG